MRMLLVWTIALSPLYFTAGCALVPPPARQCEGEFRPVNPPADGRTTARLSATEVAALCRKGGADGRRAA